MTFVDPKSSRVLPGALSEYSVKTVSDTNLSTVRFRAFTDIPYARQIAAELGFDVDASRGVTANIFGAMSPFMESRYVSSERLIDVTLGKMPESHVIEFAAGYNMHSAVLSKKFPRSTYLATDEHAPTLVRRMELEKKLGLGRDNARSYRLDAVSGEGLLGVGSQIQPGKGGILFVEGLWRYLTHDKKAAHLQVARNLLTMLDAIDGERINPARSQKSCYITPDAVTRQEYEEFHALTDSLRTISTDHGRSLQMNFEDNCFADEQHRDEFLAANGFQIAQVHRQGDIVDELSAYANLADKVQLNEQQWLRIRHTIANRKLFVLELQ